MKKMRKNKRKENIETIKKAVIGNSENKKLINQNNAHKIKYK